MSVPAATPSPGSAKAFVNSAVQATSSIKEPEGAPNAGTDRTTRVQHRSVPGAALTAKHAQTHSNA